MTEPGANCFDLKRRGAAANSSVAAGAHGLTKRMPSRFVQVKDFPSSTERMMFHMGATAFPASFRQSGAANKSLI